MKMVRDFERKLAAAALARDPELSRLYDTRQLTLEGLDELRDPARAAALRTVPERPGPAAGPVRIPAVDGPGPGRRAPAGPDRTELLVNQGRGSAYRPSRWRQRKFLIGAGAALLVVIIVVVTIVLSSGASWPASVATVKSEITTACRQPRRDVRARPGQLCLRQADAAGPVGLLPALQREQPAVQRPHDRPAGPRADHPGPGR